MNKQQKEYEIKRAKSVITLALINIVLFSVCIAMAIVALVESTKIDWGWIIPLPLNGMCIGCWLTVLFRWIAHIKELKLFDVEDDN